MSNPYDTDITKTSPYLRGNTTYNTKASGRGSSAWNKANSAVKNPYNQPFNATGDAPNQDYSGHSSQTATATKAPAAAAPPKPQSTGSKVLKFAKGFASAMTTGEQKFAQGITRDLPGGTNDLNAEAKSSQADQNAQKTYATLFKQGKINKAQYQKATGTAAKQANQTSSDVKATEKSMPTKTQIGIGAASTAADVLTAGSLSKIKGAKVGLTSSRILKTAKVAAPLIETGTKAGKVANVTGRLAANATAGGLNAAAGGGDKKTIAENAVAGAALPEVLHIGGTLAVKGGAKVIDKLPKNNTADAKSLLTNARAQTLLDKAHNTPDAPTAEPHDAQAPQTPEYTPTNPKVKTLVEARQRQAEAAAAPMKAAAAEQSKTAATAEKTAAQGQKIDRQVELLQAKQKDAGGELSNVDKTKLQHLQEDKQNLTTPTRPNDELQTKIEQAHNSGDTALEKQLTDQLPDQGMNPNASLSAEAKQALMDKARAKAAVPDAATTPTAKPAGEAAPEPAPKATEPSAKPASASSEASVAPTERNTNKEPKLSNRQQTEYKPRMGEPTVVPIDEKVPERATQASETSGSALNAEAKAVRKGLVQEFADKAEYNAGSYKDEAASAVKLVKEDPQRAMDIATGKIPGDNTIHEVAVARALENKAFNEKDGATLLKLAQSPRHSVTSEAAQRLGAEGYGEKNSVVKTLASLKKLGQESYKKRTGKDFESTVKGETKTVTKDTLAVKAKDWNSFVEALKC